MTLQKRLAKLEAQRQRQPEGPRLIFINACWRTDDGHLRSIAELANVRTASGWQMINRAETETESGFRLRAEAMAG